MKTCPVCRARTFEDAEVCYGCLHRFDGGGRAAAVAEETAWEPAEVVQRAASVPPSAQAQLRCRQMCRCNPGCRQARGRNPTCRQFRARGLRCRRAMLLPQEIPPLRTLSPLRETAPAVRASRLPASRRPRGRARRDPPVEPAVLSSPGDAKRSRRRRAPRATRLRASRAAVRPRRLDRALRSARRRCAGIRRTWRRRPAGGGVRNPPAWRGGGLRAAVVGGQHLPAARRGGGCRRAGSARCTDGGRPPARRGRAGRRSCICGPRRQAGQACRPPLAAAAERGKAMSAPYVIAASMLGCAFGWLLRPLGERCAAAPGTGSRGRLVGRIAGGLPRVQARSSRGRAVQLRHRAPRGRSAYGATRRSPQAWRDRSPRSACRRSPQSGSRSGAWQRRGPPTSVAGATRSSHAPDPACSARRPSAPRLPSRRPSSRACPPPRCWASARRPWPCR